MRVFFAGCVLFVVSVPAVAQTVLLQSLDFLKGIWVTDEIWGRPARSAEFHWSERQGKAIFRGRVWTGDASECPWRVAQAVITAFNDAASNQVHLRFRDNTWRAIDFRLVSAGSSSAQFVSVSGLGPRTYRLTFELLPECILAVTLERGAYPDNAFLPVARWQYHRDGLIQRH